MMNILHISDSSIFIQFQQIWGWGGGGHQNNYKYLLHESYDPYAGHGNTFNTNITLHKMWLL